MSWLQDLRFAARTLLRYPWTHGAAAFILAVSLGAVLGALSLMDEMLWSPLPGIERAERVAWLYGARGQRGVDENRDDAIPLGNALYFSEHAHSLAQVGWFTGRRKVLLGSAEPEVLSGFGVSAQFFPLLGAQPRLGRLLTPADTEPGARPVVVLGEGFWRQRFAADPALLGSQLNLDGVAHTVVGITPERFFAQIGMPAQIWLPYALDAAQVQDRSETVPTLARLADGVSFAAVNTELAQLSQAIADAHPHTDRGLSTHAVPLPDVMTRFRPLAFALVLAATFVLAAAGAVAANLLLAQAAERSRELAIRQALGASRAAILGQWCVQVAALMLVAVAAGTLLGQWAIDATLTSMPSSLKMSSFGTPEARLSWRAWWGTVGIAAAATPFIGLVPAHQASRMAIGSTLRDGGGGTLGKARGGRTRRMLVGLQLALASALTFGAACAYLGFVAAREAPLGFEPAEVTQLTLPNVDADPAERGLLLSRLQRALSAGGAVQLAQASDALLTRGHDQLTFHVEGTPRPSADALPWAKRNDVSPGYFSLLGIPLRAGRAFAASDDVHLPCVAVLSERLARTSFGEPGAALGKRLHVDRPRPAAGASGSAAPAAASTTCEIIGVAGDVRDVLPGSPGDLYLASAQWPPGGDILYVRGAGADELARLKAHIQRLDPRQAVWEQPLPEVVAASTWGARMLAAMFMVLAFVGCSLAGVGTYAVLAHSASLRRRELGLRAVLGARPRELAWLVVTENLSAGLLGIVVGVAVVAAGLVAVARFQPALWLYLIAAGLMACLLAGSSLLSARRVLALEPGLALRRR